jgi:ATPase subunit of ABC transporter with duplicated ATPase domains
MRTLISINGKQAAGKTQLAKAIKNAIIYEEEEYSSLTSLLRIIRLDAKLFKQDVKESFVVVLKEGAPKDTETIARFCEKFQFTLVKMQIC